MENPCKNCKHLCMNDHYDDYSQYYCEYRNEYVKLNWHCSGFEALPKIETDEICFLTTACVEYFKKPDDCYELTTLRRYRDEFLKSTSSGQQLVNEYYLIAPKIVKKINDSENRDEYYQYIFSIVNKCVKLIENNEYEKTKDEYMNMVLKLKTDLNVTA